MDTHPPLPFQVIAVAAYNARNNAEVSLEVQKTYLVTQTDGKGLWWQTQSEQGTYGWFPASYTQVITTPPASVPTPVVSQPPVQVATNATASVPVVSARSESVSTGNNATTAATPAVKANNSVPDKPPHPSKPPAKERGESPVFVKLQIVEAKNLNPQGKLDPTAFIYRRNVMGDKLGNLLFKTTTLKKATNPNWNEQFQINVADAEMEIISIRFGHGSKLEKKFKGPKFFGEIEFPLRGAVRDFDKPNYKFKWFPITAGKLCTEERTGEALIYIEFIDTRQSEGPHDVQHKGHVGISKDGGFEIRDIPPEWKNIFRNIGLRKQDLENNPNLANQVLEIMQNATPEQLAEGLKNQSDETPELEVQQHRYEQPEQTTSVQVAAPPPPPAPTVKGPTPPPPPAVTGPPAPKPPPAIHTPAHTETSTTTANTNTSSTTSVFAQIQQGVALKKVDTTAPKPPPVSSAAPSLTDTLLAAMKNHRKDIEGDDKSDDDGWSE